MARIITITSGKGGVGKTSISLNLSLALAKEGYKVCLFDADLGLANVNILTGIYPDKDLASVISGQFRLHEIMIKNYQGIDIIPGSSGVEKIADLTRTQTGTLISAFLDLEDYDFFIFDTSAGVSAQVISFCMASHEIVLVATCEPTSLTDAYSMLKVLAKYGYENPIRVVINQVKSGRAAQQAYAQLKRTAERFLSIKLQPLGIMASDKNVRTAVISQTPFFSMFPESVASRCVRSLRDKLLNRTAHSFDIPLELFWDKALRFLDDQYRPGTSKEAAPEKHQEEKDVSPDIQKALAKIDERITGLAEEIRQIKQILVLKMKTRGVNVPKKADSPAENRQSTAPAVPLDFEAWYKKLLKSSTG